MQVRHINYELGGIEDKQVPVSAKADYTFFNPKAGLTWQLPANQTLYASYAVAHREPVRSDFTDRPLNDAGPRAEQLHDLEGGYRLNRTVNGQMLRAEVNGFYMRYRNQLVNTGQLNDVGTPLRTNAPRSYRAGVELTAAYQPLGWLTLNSTLTLSRNRILDYRAVTYDKDYNPVVAAEGRTTTISYSPSVVSAHTVEVMPVKGLRAALLYKTVGRQYLDNTESANKAVAAYQVLDLRLRYTVQPSFMRELELGLLVNNLLNREYVANGYTYGYPDATGQPLTFSYYYPQATRNFLASVGVKF